MIVAEAFSNKINLIYVLLSLFGLHINFVSLKKLLHSENSIHHFYAVATSMILPVFHLYVFNFCIIPFLNIDISENITLYYISFSFRFISLFPYIIARRLYT